MRQSLLITALLRNSRGDERGFISTVSNRFTRSRRLLEGHMLRFLFYCLKVNNHHRHVRVESGSGEGGD